MSASSPVPKDHPLMVAWTAYKATEDYANTKRSAGLYDGATDGSLWASFERGWLAAGGLEPFAALALTAPATGAPDARPDIQVGDWVSDIEAPDIPYAVRKVEQATECSGRLSRFVAEIRKANGQSWRRADGGH